jgi:hypothetical protein
MDEASKQLIGEVRDPLPTRPGRIRKYDSEYKRLGTANIFMAVEPLAGQRTVRVTDRRTKLDWAEFIRHLLEDVYADAEVVVLVMDNLNTHSICTKPSKRRRHDPWHLGWKFTTRRNTAVG